jgi:hypothetical protein
MKKFVYGPRWNSLWASVAENGYSDSKILSPSSGYSKCWYPPTRLHGVRTQTATILIFTVVIVYITTLKSMYCIMTCTKLQRRSLQFIKILRGRFINGISAQHKTVLKQMIEIHISTAYWCTVSNFTKIWLNGVWHTKKFIYGHT